jgi:hypothetical protein
MHTYIHTYIHTTYIHDKHQLHSFIRTYARTHSHKSIDHTYIHIHHFLLCLSDEDDEEDEKEMGFFEMLAIDQNQVDLSAIIHTTVCMYVCMYICMYVIIIVCTLQLPAPIRSISQEVQGASTRLKKVIRNEVRLP